MGVHVHADSGVSLESGYASGASSSDSLPSILLTKNHLKFLNYTLSELSPVEILRWCKLTFPNLYQTTAFGVTGLVTLDMLSKLQTETPSAPSIDAIFLDTLYHFQETLNLVEKAKARYPNVNLHVYKPEGVNTTAEFEARHGTELWATNADLYDWVAKVEPAQRAYSELQVAAVLTGRRRSQGAKRESLDIIEIDEAGLIKINPLASWSFQQVQDYIRDNNVPYNELLDRGYKSVGDWHSTEPVKAGEDERAGRWKGTAKTECGIHNKRSKYAQFLYEMEQKKLQEELSAALATVEAKEDVPVLATAPVDVIEETTTAVEKVESKPLSASTSEEVDVREVFTPTGAGTGPASELSALELITNAAESTLIPVTSGSIQHPIVVSISNDDVDIAATPEPTVESPTTPSTPIATDTPQLISASSTSNTTPNITTPTLEKELMLENVEVSDEQRSLHPALPASHDVGISDGLTSALEKCNPREEQLSHQEEIIIQS